MRRLSVFVALMCLSGCGATSAGAVAHTVARATCGVVARAHEVCQAAGLSPGESCPMPIRVAVDAE